MRFTTYHPSAATITMTSSTPDAGFARRVRPPRSCIAGPGSGRGALEVVAEGSGARGQTGGGIAEAGADADAAAASTVASGDSLNGCAEALDARKKMKMTRASRVRVMNRCVAHRRRGRVDMLLPNSRCSSPSTFRRRDRSIAMAARDQGRGGRQRRGSPGTRSRMWRVRSSTGTSRCT